MSAVVDVMWLAKTTRVRGVAASSRRCAQRAGVEGQRHRRRAGTCAPRCRQTNSQVASQAPYSWSVASTSSPGCRRSERATVLTPWVALGRKTRSSPRAPRKAPSRCARLGQQGRRAAAQEGHRVALQLQLPALVGLEHRLRAGAEGAVVEEDDVGVEQEGVAHEGGIFAACGGGAAGEGGGVWVRIAAMAAGSLLLLLDDIASVLDDVAVLSKVAAKKTAGVLGDDLALNAQQLTGFSAQRELPVVWAVAKGSFINKAILVPAALAISAFAPWAVTPLLMVGGAFLCYEGFEKIAHRFLHRRP